MEELLSGNIAQISFHVRYAETDAMGIVHHATYLVWFEEARSAFMRLMNTSYTEFEADGVALAVSEANVRYLAPARYDRLVAVQCKIDNLKSRSVTFSYNVLDAETGQTLATGITHHICVTPDKKVTRIPQKWHRRWADAL